MQTETAKEEEQGQTGSRSPESQPREETTEAARAATTRELIAASVVEQAKSLMTEVRYFCFDVVTLLHHEGMYGKAEDIVYFEVLTGLLYCGFIHKDRGRAHSLTPL